MNYKLPKITKPVNGRRIAIGDIHGCLNTFKELVNKIDLKQNDQLFILGDLIDKGEKSRGVVDFIIDLMDKFNQVYVLKGNHEQSFIMAFECGYEFFANYLEKNKADEFLDDGIYDYLEFFDKLEYGYELDDFVVSHTEFLINEQSLYRGMRGLFSSIKFQIDDNTMNEKTQIVGHTVKTLEQIKEIIQQEGKVLYLDNGCVHKNNEGLGNLLGLNIDTKELFIQKNID